MEDFKPGSYYTREQIHKRLGGGTQDFLPHKDGVVVCVCVTPELNPHLPVTILAGEGKQVPRWARVFAQQMNFIPLFVKRASNRWEYIGNFRAKTVSDDPREIARHKTFSGRDDIVLVLHMEKEVFMKEINEYVSAYEEK